MFLLYEPSWKEPEDNGLRLEYMPRLMEREKGAELRQLLLRGECEQIYLQGEPCSIHRGLNASFFTSHSARRNYSQFKI